MLLLGVGLSLFLVMTVVNVNTNDGSSDAPSVSDTFMGETLARVPVDVTKHRTLEQCSAHIRRPLVGRSDAQFNIALLNHNAPDASNASATSVR